MYHRRPRQSTTLVGILETSPRSALPRDQQCKSHLPSRWNGKNARSRNLLFRKPQPGNRHKTSWTFPVTYPNSKYFLFEDECWVFGNGTFIWLLRGKM